MVLALHSLRPVVLRGLYGIAHINLYGPFFYNDEVYGEQRCINVLARAEVRMAPVLCSASPQWLIYWMFMTRDALGRTIAPEASPAQRYGIDIRVGRGDTDPTNPDVGRIFNEGHNRIFRTLRTEQPHEVRQILYWMVNDFVTFGILPQDGLPDPSNWRFTRLRRYIARIQKGCTPNVIVPSMN